MTAMGVALSEYVFEVTLTVIGGSAPEYDPGVLVAVLQVAGTYDIAPLDQGLNQQIGRGVCGFVS